MRSTRTLVIAAEVGLALVTLATVLGMSRLFAGGGWLAPLAANAVTAHATASILRRRGVSLPMAGAAMGVGAALVASWTTYLSTTTLGIPTGATWSAMQDDLGSAWTLYQDVVAPAPVEPGFVLATAVALWCVAFVADWAAFRLWVPFEATLPAGTLFLFTALLGTPRGRSWSIALFAASIIGFLLLHRMAHQEGNSHWVADRREVGQRSMLTAGAALGLIAVVTGTVLGPSVPGAESPGVFDPTALNDGDDARTTISPLVDIRSRLVDQAEIELFQVRSPRPSYWRLTALERFDGTIWRSNGSFGSADGALSPSVESNVPTETFEQTFSVTALAALWLPAAYEPRAVTAESLDIRYDDESSTLIVDDDRSSSDGFTYRVRSASPRITQADLAGDAAEIPEDIRETYLQLPDAFSERVKQLSRELTASATSPYEQARMLQDHLRTFTYDLQVAQGHSGDALEHFLFTAQRGYCEQFAGSFAAMARSIGLPARVAVGFTQGVADAADPELYRVRGEHAHAWPEVYLAGAGWVTFEPTPGRGQPFAEAHTGVAPSQAATGQPGSPTTATPTTATTTPSGQGPDASIRSPDLGLGTGAAPEDAADDGGSDAPAVRYLLRPLARVAPILAIAVVAYLVLLPVGLLIRRHLRRRRAVTAEQRIAVSWTEAMESASVVGFEEDATETYWERSSRLAATLPDVEREALTLAGWVEVASYSAAGASDDDAEAAAEMAAQIGAAARRSATRSARLARWLDPRPLIDAWRRDRRAAHHRITTTARADLELERELV